MNAWTVVLAAGLGSYLLRLSMVGATRIRLPDRFDYTLSLAAPAAFIALAISSLAAIGYPAGVASAAHPGSYIVLAATAAGTVAAVRTGKAYAAVVAGMPTFWLLTAAFG
jgi:branched-subunit amino acid transport protein